MTTLLERPPEEVDDRFLVSRVGTRQCALAIGHVTETTGPVACASLAGAPDFVLGIAEVRCAAVPVVDTGRLLGSTPARATRVVSPAVEDGRTVALAVLDSELVIFLRESRLVPESVWGLIELQRTH